MWRCADALALTCAVIKRRYARLPTMNPPSPFCPMRHFAMLVAAAFDAIIIIDAR